MINNKKINIIVLVSSHLRQIIIGQIHQTNYISGSRINVLIYLIMQKITHIFANLSLILYGVHTKVCMLEVKSLCNKY